MDKVMNSLLQPDKHTSKKKGHHSHPGKCMFIILTSSICTCHKLDKTEKDKAEIKVKRKQVNVGFSLIFQIMLLSSKAHLRGHPGSVNPDTKDLIFACAAVCSHVFGCNLVIKTKICPAF